MQRFIILLAVCAIGWAAQADAHGKRGKRGMRGDHQAKVAEALGLTDEQVTQLAALKEGKTGQREAAREERKAAFEAILTEDQLAILNAHRENREEGSHRKGERPDLGLSEEQLAEMAALREQHKEAALAAREEFRAAFEAILTAEQLAIFEELKGDCSGRGNKDEDTDGDSAADAAAALQLGSVDAEPSTAIDETSWGRIKEQRAP